MANDNSCINIKKYIRKKIYKKGMRILSLCHGYGISWEGICDKNNILGIDIQNKKNDIKIDNKLFLNSIDVNKYDIIDIDVYGLPINLLDILFSKEINKNITVIYTMIYSRLTPIYSLAKGYEKVPQTILNKYCLDFFSDYLHKHSIDAFYNIKKEENMIKNYGYFEIKRVSSNILKKKAV